MNDGPLVRVGQSVSDLRGVSKRLLQRQPFARRDQSAERLSLDVLHDDVLVADFVDGTDAGVIQTGGGARFAQESYGPAIVARDRLQHLDRHGAVQPRIVRTIHDAHAAASDERLDPVLRERRADHDRCEFPLPGIAVSDSGFYVRRV